MDVHVMLSKHKIIMGIVVFLTRDPEMRITSFPRKSISVVDRVVKFLVNLITNVIAWLWNNQFGMYYQIIIDCLAT